MILDDDYFDDSQEMLECLLEAIGVHCQVECAIGKVLEEKHDVISNEHFEIAEA